MACWLLPPLPPKWMMESSCRAGCSYTLGSRLMESKVPKGPTDSSLQSVLPVVTPCRRLRAAPAGARRWPLHAFSEHAAPSCVRVPKVLSTQSGEHASVEHAAPSCAVVPKVPRAQSGEHSSHGMCNAVLLLLTVAACLRTTPAATWWSPMPTAVGSRVHGVTTVGLSLSRLAPPDRQGGLPPTAGAGAAGALPR